MSRKILILGGSRFHGLLAAEKFSKGGDEVYVLNRGNFRPEYSQNITHLIADRNDEKKLQETLAGKVFDIVIDNNGYYDFQIKLILKAIKGRCDHYIFTSTTAAYLKHTSEHKLSEKDEAGIQDGIYPPDVKPYAINKFFAEQYLKQNAENLNYTILRLPNVFGEYDFLGKLYFFYEKLKSGKKLLLEKEIDRFSIIYFRDIVNVWEKVMGNKECFGRVLNIVDDKDYNYDEFFKEIYGDLYSKDKKVLMEAEKMWDAGYVPLFPWGPKVDSSLSKDLLGIDYAHLETWGKKSLQEEIEKFKNKPKDAKIKKMEKLELSLIKQIESKKNLIIRSSYSKLPNGELKSNFGDLLRSTVLIECLGDNFIWLTDNRAKDLLKWLVDREKIMSIEEFAEKGLLSDNYEIYNLDNYVTDKEIFRQLKGKWYGYVYDGSNKVSPENELIESITPYVFSDIKKSWQQALVEGLGFVWKEQDYSSSLVNAKNNIEKKEFFDVGLNWNVHPEWTSKHWSKEYWGELEKILKEDYSVSWQQGLDNFDEYVKWINSCKLIVTCDTLGMHLASALKKKVISIVGPTESREFSYNRITFIKPPQRPCMPCNKPVCEEQEHCLKEITPRIISLNVNGLLRNS